MKIESKTKVNKSIQNSKHKENDVDVAQNRDENNKNDK